MRHERKLARRGALTLARVKPEEADAALEAMFDQHIARRLAAGDESLFLNEHSREFYKGLVACADFADFGCFDALKAGDRDVAYHFGLYGAATFIWYKPTFDMNLQHEGPGEVLFKALVEHASAAGHSYFDFSRGDEPFKLRFANVQRRNRRLRHRLPISHAVARRIRAEADQLRGKVARSLGAPRSGVARPAIRANRDSRSPARESGPAGGIRVRVGPARPHRVRQAALRSARLRRRPSGCASPSSARAAETVC